jgi:hypothetical protein
VSAGVRAKEALILLRGVVRVHVVGQSVVCGSNPNPGERALMAGAANGGSPPPRAEGFLR